LKLRPEEITSVLKSRIKSYEAGVDIQEVGTVVQVGDGVARIQGLENAVASEMLELPHGVTGLVLNLEEDSVGAVLMGEDTLIKEGDQAKRTGRVIQVPVGDVTKGLVADLSAFQNDPLYQTFNPAIMNMMNYYGFQGGLPQGGKGRLHRLGHAALEILCTAHAAHQLVDQNLALLLKQVKAVPREIQLLLQQQMVRLGRRDIEPLRHQSLPPDAAAAPATVLP